MRAASGVEARLETVVKRGTNNLRNLTIINGRAPRGARRIADGAPSNGIDDPNCNVTGFYVGRRAIMMAFRAFGQKAAVGDDQYSSGYNVIT